MQFSRLLSIFLMFAMLAPTSTIASTLPFNNNIPHLDRGDIASAKIASLSDKVNTRSNPPSELDPYEPWTNIVFQSYRDGNWEIYRARGNAAAQTRLTNNPAADTSPQLNRGATQIVFESTRDGNTEIYRMNIDGTGVRRLTVSAGDDLQPTWSPDGTKIVFTSARNGKLNLYMMNADGSGQTRITNTAQNDITPSWSPDGTRITWILSSGATGILWVMNSDGSNAHAITGSLSYLQNAVWSPDSTRIAFDYKYMNGNTPFMTIGIIKADGTGLTNIAPEPASANIDHWMSAWSPDGAFVFTSYFNYYKEKNSYIFSRVYIRAMKSNGYDLRDVIDTGFDMLPSVQTNDVSAPRAAIKALSPYTQSSSSTIQWSGTDFGTSGLASYDVQYRVGDDNWTTWQQATSETSAVFPATSGTKVSFRARAHDIAGNIQPWNDLGDTSTTFYATHLSGSITDNRGNPLPDFQFNLTPSAINTVHSTTNGLWNAWFTNTGLYSLTGAQTGYATLQATEINVQQEQSHDFYLAPENSTIQNGLFESSTNSLDNWATSGSLPVGITTSANTGKNAAFLGQITTIPTFSEQAQITTSGRFPQVVADSAGLIHLFWVDNGHILYSNRNIHTPWADKLDIGEGDTYYTAVDGLDRIHTIWINSSSHLIYRIRDASGVWSEPIDLGMAMMAQIVADHLGGAHITSRCYSSGDCPHNDNDWYIERLPDGTWRDAIDIGSKSYRWQLAAGPDGSIYIAWEDSSNLFYRFRRPGSLSWEKPVQLVTGIVATGSQLYTAVTSTGTVNIFFSTGSSTKIIRGTNGVWEPIETLPKFLNSLRVTTDKRGNTYLIGNSTVFNDSGTFYFQHPAEGGWSQPLPLNLEYYGVAPAIAIDALENIHLVDISLHYLVSSTATNDGNSHLQQTVSIPADAHQSTLAFAYNLHGISPYSSSAFHVVVANATGSTTVFTGTSTSSWDLGWIDMQPWAGQEVTIDFSLQQAKDMPFAGVEIDDVSLGDWLTPVISQVTPNHLLSSTANIITITGSNFIGTPTVHIDNNELTGVQRIDDHTLQATLPQGLNYGRPIVWVMNPGGQRAAYSQLLIGTETYLPFTNR